MLLLIPASLNAVLPGKILEHVSPHWPAINAEWILALWVSGCVLSVAWLAWQQLRFERALAPFKSPDPPEYGLATVPSVIGLFRPTILLPPDFKIRYNDEQQAMILAHERIHIERGDMTSNALALLLRSILWFNPLLYFAYPRFRLDQELACDAEILRHFPETWRSKYAKAILLSQGIDAVMPARLAWTSNNQIKERLMNLKTPKPRIALSRSAGVLLMSVIGLTATYTSWASQSLIRTMSVQWIRPASGSSSVEFSSKQATRTADGGVDLSEDVVFKVAVDSLRIDADDLKSSDDGDSHRLVADGHVEIQFGNQTVTTAHAMIVEKSGTAVITMERAHVDNPGY